VQDGDGEEQYLGYLIILANEHTSYLNAKVQKIDHLTLHLLLV
jgi:hypothetical protein